MQQESAARDVKAIRSEATFGILQGVLSTFPVKIPLLFLIAGTHPAGYIVGSSKKCRDLSFDVQNKVSSGSNPTTVHSTS